MIKQKKFLFTALVIGVVLFLAFGANPFYAEYKPAKDDLYNPAKTVQKYSPTRIMVQADNLKEAKRIAAEFDLKVVKDFKALSKARGHWYGVFEAKKGSSLAVAEMVQILNTIPGIRQAGLDYEVSIVLTPNDPKFSELWGLHNTGQTGGTADADIDAPEAWDLATGSANVIIAVIDTGVDYNHTDLSPNMWHNPAETPGNGIDDDSNGYVDDIYGIDGCNNDADPWDDHYHGTHCAGTIGAKGNDGFGVVGVNWNVKIMALKFLNSSGSGSTSDAVECMNYLIDQKQKGQNIIASSNSWGGGGADQSLLDAINTAGNLGVLFIAAAGNNSSNNDSTPFYPACYDSQYVVAVAATDHNDALASFSNYGANTVELGAPGVSIVSDSPGGGFRTLSGTSMATPHVSGAVGLMAAVFPNDTAMQRKNRILEYVDPIPALSGKTITGGRLNVYQAVQSAPFVVAKFSWTKQGDLTRLFTDESTANYCTITGWNWNFGDGGTSTEQNPSHTYASAGFYDVILTVTADTGATDSDTQTLWAGPNQAPTANFSYTTPGGFQAKFTDQSTDPDGTIDGWDWDFGDGGSSTQQNPTHQYQYPGTYTVTLTATDNEGASDSETKDVAVPLSYCASSGSSANPVAIIGVEIGSFSNSSGKSTYSDFMNMTANMNRGQTYNVTITTDSSFWDCYTRIYIDYNLDGDFSDANEIAFEVFITTGSYTGQMTIPSAGVVTGKKVGMRVSAKTNSYRLPCGVNDGWGEVEDYTALFDPSGNLPPDANFTYTTSDLTANFTDTSTDSDGTIESWSWNFGDGGTSTAQNPSHTYASAGTYTVTLTVTDDDGATDSISKDVTVSAPGNQPPTANFTYTTDLLTVNFTDTSTDSDGTVVSWSWNFGDSGTSTAQNPSHTYASAGTYTVTLTVTDDDGATDSESKDVTVSDGGGIPTYCASSSISTNPGYITQVVVGSFSNSSGAAKYSDFTNMTVNLTKGQTYSVSLTPYTSSSIWDCYWRIWIDYNRDGDFTDPGELAFENWMKDQNGQPLNGTITVPASGVVTGQKLGMRVSFKISSYRDVCATNSGWGEVEDYAVIIQ